MPSERPWTTLRLTTRAARLKQYVGAHYDVDRNAVILKGIYQSVIDSGGVRPASDPAKPVEVYGPAFSRHLGN